MSMFVQNRPASAWQQMENWRAKQKQFTADFEAFNSNLVSTLTTAFSSANEGMIEITMAAAQQRASERAKLSRIDTLV